MSPGVSVRGELTISGGVVKSHFHYVDNHLLSTWGLYRKRVRTGHKQR